MIYKCFTHFVLGHEIQKCQNFNSLQRWVVEKSASSLAYHRFRARVGAHKRFESGVWK